MQAKIKCRIVGLAAIVVSIVGAGLWPSAQIRVPGHIRTTVSPSSMMAPNKDLPCMPKPGGGIRCGSEEWLAEQARLEGWQQLNHGWDGQIQIDYDQGDWVQPPSRQTAERPGEKSEQKINLNLTTSVTDPETGETLRLDTSSFSPSLRQELTTIANNSLSAVQNFLESRERIAQIRKEFQNFFNQAAAQQRAYVDEIRRYNKELARKIDQAEKDAVTRAAELASRLNPKNLPPDLLEAIRNANELKSHPLRHLDVQMTPEAVAILEQLLAQLIANGKVGEATEQLEKLVVGTVDGAPIRSATAESVAGDDGVIDLGKLKESVGAGPFDDRSFETETYSSEGQAVRRMANRYQAMFHESNGLAYMDSPQRARFVGGASAVSAADVSLAAGDLSRGSALLELADVLADSIDGFTDGMGESLTELARSVPEIATLLKDGAYVLVTDPEKAWANTLEFVSRLDEIKSLIVQGLSNDWETLKNGNAYERSRILGYYALDVAQLFISGGAAGTVKVASKAGGIARAMDKISDGRKVISRFVDARMARRAGQSVEKYLAEATDLVPEVRKGLEKLNTDSPKGAYAILKERTRAIREGNGTAKEFTERLMASGQDLANQPSLRRAMDIHRQVNNHIGKVNGVTYEGKISRVADRYTRVNGELIAVTPENIFDKHPGQKLANHRFTVGGELGHSALYVGMGGIEDTKYILALELKDPAAMVLGERHVQLSHLLDLREAEVLRALGITTKEIKGDYLVSQAIGDVAKANGFRGIISYSVYGNEVTNIAIFH